MTPPQDGTTSASPVVLSAESPSQLYDILEATNGQLVVDAHDTFENRRPFYRVTPAGVKMALVTETDDSDAPYQIDTRDVTEQDLLEVVELADSLKLWPYHDSPFTAVDP